MGAHRDLDSNPDSYDCELDAPSLTSPTIPTEGRARKM